MFWWQRDIFRFFINNTRMHRNDQHVTFTATATAGGFFSLIIGNFFIEGNISLDELEQQQEEFTDATGDDMADLLDFGFII